MHEILAPSYRHERGLQGTRLACFTRTKLHTLTQKTPLQRLEGQRACGRVYQQVGLGRGVGAALVARMLTYADVFRRMLTYADAFLRMQDNMHAGAFVKKLVEAVAPQVAECVDQAVYTRNRYTHNRSKTCLPALRVSGVCKRRVRGASTYSRNYSRNRAAPSLPAYAYIGM